MQPQITLSLYNYQISFIKCVEIQELFFYATVYHSITPLFKKETTCQILQITFTNKSSRSWRSAFFHQTVSYQCSSCIHVAFPNIKWRLWQPGGYIELIKGKKSVTGMHIVKDKLLLWWKAIKPTHYKILMIINVHRLFYFFVVHTAHIIKVKRLNHKILIRFFFILS